MRDSSLRSTSEIFICPFCEVGSILLSGSKSTRCESCGELLSREVLQTLQQIAGLPDTLGNHPCECGHPEMRQLPDRTFHCPACGSEVLPLGAPPVSWRSDNRSEAYWAGWLDGRFGANGSFVDNPNLARFEEPSDRLDYYRGHRAGREASPFRVNSAARQSSEKQPL